MFIKLYSSNSEKLMKALNLILNSRNRVKKREKDFHFDAIDVDLDFNFNRNKKTKECLKTLNLNGVILHPKDFILNLKQQLLLILIV